MACKKPSSAPSALPMRTISRRCSRASASSFLRAASNTTNWRAERSSGAYSTHNKAASRALPSSCWCMATRAARSAARASRVRTADLSSSP
jgi:hypothetical protein